MIKIAAKRIKRRYVFAVGFEGTARETVTVSADSYTRARIKAFEELDRRAERDGRELPDPASWIIEPINIGELK